MIAPESCSKHAIYGCKHRTDQYSGHRESVSDSFGNCNNIRFDSGILVSEEFATTSVTALYFIQNQDCSVFCTGFAELLQEFGSRYFDTANSLYTFNDDSTNIFFCQFGFRSLYVI